ENLFKGDIDATPILGGVVAGRIHDIPGVEELIDGIIKEAASVLEELKTGNY
ncbi:MAG: nitronate monooxygenase, partial [Deltaproteobacteria bacterium]|nr:nitronate monooxygenase [Deltaproteobacteria bacterium]